MLAEMVLFFDSVLRYYTLSLSPTYHNCFFFRSQLLLYYPRDTTTTTTTIHIKTCYGKKLSVAFLSWYILFWSVCQILWTPCLLGLVTKRARSLKPFKHFSCTFSLLCRTNTGCVTLTRHRARWTTCIGGKTVVIYNGCRQMVKSL